jgi:NAD(P)-dependent dehydrogenase (short-subunit alcohol dehydrogenase family)
VVGIIRTSCVCVEPSAGSRGWRRRSDVPYGAGRGTVRPVTSLDGAAILVAGGSGGLGAAISRLLAQRGARLTLVGRNAERLAATGIEGAALHAADLTEAGAPQRCVEAAAARWGRLDGVVNAAGVVAFGPAVEADDATLDAVLGTNLLMPIRLVRAAYPHLHASAVQGRAPFVLMVSAVVAEAPMAGMAAYTASKAGLAAFDAAAGRELRRSRIRLVDARPPHTETGLATRPVAGQAPTLPPGKDPRDVAARLVQAIVDDERDVPSSAF